MTRKKALLQSYRIHQPYVAYEVIEREVVAVDLRDGSYYSLSGTGKTAWLAFGADGAAVDDVVRLLATIFASPRCNRVMRGGLSGTGLRGRAPDGRTLLASRATVFERVARVVLARSQSVVGSVAVPTPAGPRYTPPDVFPTPTIG